MTKEEMKKDIDRLMEDWNLEGLVIHAEGKDGVSTTVCHGTYHIGSVAIDDIKAFTEHLKEEGVSAREAADMLSTAVAVILAGTFGKEGVTEMSEALKESAEANKKCLEEKEEVDG